MLEIQEVKLDVSNRDSQEHKLCQRPSTNTRSSDNRSFKSLFYLSPNILQSSGSLQKLCALNYVQISKYTGWMDSSSSLHLNCREPSDGNVKYYIFSLNVTESSAA